MRLACIAFLGLCVVALSGVQCVALADCDSGIQHLQTVIEDLDPGRLKSLVQLDLGRALRESDEADETECAKVLDHADRLLQTMR